MDGILNMSKMSNVMPKSGSYKIIKYCKSCKTRMVFMKGEPQHYYCAECRKKF